MTDHTETHYPEANLMTLQKTRSMVFRLAPLALALLVSACAVGPDYKRPDVAMPTAFKEAKGWTAAIPKIIRPKATGGRCIRILSCRPC